MIPGASRAYDPNTRGELFNEANTVLRGSDEMGVAEVSSTLFSRVTQYHAQIGAQVNKDVLQTLEWNLLSEAKTLFHQQKYEDALNTFTHCLAVTEKTRSAKDQAVRGAIVHNIASCLHNLGEMEAAQAYYEQAIDAFKKAKVPVLERVIYGDPNKRRVEFVKERLVDITWGRKPDGDKYLDENGVKRPVPASALPPAGTTAADSLSDSWGDPNTVPPAPWVDGGRRPGWLAAADGGFVREQREGHGDEEGRDDYDEPAGGGYDASDAASYYHQPRERGQDDGCRAGEGARGERDEDDAAPRVSSDRYQGGGGGDDRYQGGGGGGDDGYRGPERAAGSYRGGGGGGGYRGGGGEGAAEDQGRLIDSSDHGPSDGGYGYSGASDYGRGQQDSSGMYRDDDGEWREERQVQSRLQSSGSKSEGARRELSGDDAEQETARREWLQYYMQTSDWSKAQDLVVTTEEREDLAYLMEREERVAHEGGGHRASSDRYRAKADRYRPHDDEDAELNDAARAASLNDSQQGQGASSAHVPRAAESRKVAPAPRAPSPDLMDGGAAAPPVPRAPSPKLIDDEML